MFQIYFFDNSGLNKKLIFLFLNQNMCCGYSKEMLQLMDKEILTILRKTFCLSGPYVILIEL